MLTADFDDELLYLNKYPEGFDHPNTWMDTNVFSRFGDVTLLMLFYADGQLVGRNDYPAYYTINDIVTALIL